MFSLIYALPKPLMALLGCLGILTWLAFSLLLKSKRIWNVLNAMLLVVCLFIIIDVTILRRHPSESLLELIPFISFKKAKLNEEYY